MLNVTHTGKPPGCNDRIFAVTHKARSGVIRAVPGCSLAGTVIRRDTNYRAPMDGLSVSREGTPGAPIKDQ